MIECPHCGFKYPRKKERMDNTEKFLLFICPCCLKPRKKVSIKEKVKSID